MSIETCGRMIDTIEVRISYRIIKLFSANLYSSPNKAFEELICNSYDAFADKVSFYVPSDLTVNGAYIWVCDNGESMDHNGLKDLWNIGKCLKRKDLSRDARRLQIGQFGIGKLATYVLANRLTYICKKDGRYLATTMNYEDISDDKDKLMLDEREIEEKEAAETLNTYLTVAGKIIVPFNLFGDDAEPSWTFSILTGLKPKALEIKEGRLLWVLRTALPLNPGFKLYYNGSEIESSKISKPIKRTWVLGRDDPTVESLNFASSKQEGDNSFVDFDNLKGVHGRIDLYEDSLVDSSKSSNLGRSHGIFLMVRNRLVNLDDSLLGMEAFSHGAFNRTRIIVHADELDNNLTSTRESIKESLPLQQLKEYLKKKFNNEVRKYYFDENIRKDRERNISYRLSQTSLTLSKRPLYVFAKKYFNGEIVNPILIDKPKIDNKDELLEELKKDMLGEDTIIKSIEWSILNTGDPIAKLDLMNGKLKINLLHPYIANYNDAYKSTLPLEFVAITEVLTEAHLYELGLNESIVNNVMRRRDNTLRELSLSDREGAPAIAQMLKDSLSDSTGLEDAVYRAFLALGFESTKLGRKGEPDGKADAILGYSESEKSENYSLIYDAKSTTKNKIKANTTNLATIKKHQTEDYKADYAVVVSIGYEGSDDHKSNISIISRQQEITVMKATDLMRLLLLSAPKQIGLKRLRDLFDTCYAPADVTEWINKIQNEPVKIGPVKELLETIYELQREDTEPPEVATVRMKLNEKITEKLSKAELKSLIESLKVFVPGFISIEGEKIGIQGRPDKVLEVVNSAINSVPNELQQMYLKAFSVEKNNSF
ncbi:ATP-binding protein [bacterium]|nr:ATP-binding protein [bacterium]